ncbi:sensor histidine kinase [Aureimonas leprariae]|uniref:histidine kinase n=1 Tax=Plantimonas leprariae TaxID=2615207 RepID=A0A7V7TX62_9HYPH|nr:PAS domain-containing sensor histidine kinase [Aureimonas leprariae]KAB0680748.1 PAS domain-containing protein [Aureimonas leprariae]
MLTSEVFGLIMDHDPNLVFIKDANSIVLYANRACLECYPPERRASIVGSTGLEDFPREEAALRLAEDRRAFALGESEATTTGVDYLGRCRVLLTRKRAFMTADGEQRLLGISTDITELSEREASLVRINDQLSRFTAFAAHDLRSPLASIVSALNVIRHDRQTKLGPNASDYIELATASAMSMAQQVTALLSVSRAEHRQDVRMVETDLNVLVEEARSNLSALIAQTESYILASRLPTLRVEPDLFRQLIQNLIENGIRHRADRAPQIAIRYEQAGSEHMLSVEDNGTGVAAQDAERLFQPFEQGSRTKGGSGLGLSLCRRVVSLHGGSLAVDPTYVGGCRVVVRLPEALGTVSMAAA